MNEWITVLQAADAAARWHVHQRRKGAAREPYINHLLEVATLVAEATEGKDPNLVIAALLHDAIEDCDVPPQLIAETFGTDVAYLVAEVTNDKTLEKGERKQRQVDGAHKKPPAPRSSSSPTSPSICAPWCRARRRSGRCGARSNTSPGEPKWWLMGWSCV
jgi:HD domain